MSRSFFFCIIGAAFGLSILLFLPSALYYSTDSQIRVLPRTLPTSEEPANGDVNPRPEASPGTATPFPEIRRQTAANLQIS